MKTNVSIKFNSIEEYREIERVLEGLGYESETNWNNIMIRKYNYGYIYIGFYSEFNIITTTHGEVIYNSLQEFLNDENNSL